MGLQQLSNLTGALAAAGHLDHGFMQQLGDAAAARLQAVPKVVQHTQGLRAFRIICWLAVGFSRLGVLHVGLMEQVAVYGECRCTAMHQAAWHRSCSIYCMCMCMHMH